MKSYKTGFTSVGLLVGGLSLSASTLAAVVNLPPTITGIPSTTVSAGTAYNFTPVATDPDAGDTLTFTISGKPGWASFDTTTGVLTGTPTGVNAKTYNDIVISVRDSKFNKVSLSAFNLTVTNEAPSLGGDPATTVYSGKTYRFAPTFSDANNDKLSFSISRQPAWASFNTSTGVLTGTPSDDAIGAYDNIVISATDGNLKTNLPAFNVEVSNPAPSIQGTPSANVRSGFNYRFQPTASDLNKPATGLVFSISGQPDWASFDTSTGKLEGIPVTDRTVNFDSIVISVSDGRSTVNLPAFGVTVRSGANYTDCTPSINSGTAFSCQLPAEAGTRFALNNPWQGMAIQAKTGRFQWTPTQNQVGQYYVGVSITSDQGTRQLTVPLTVTEGQADPVGIYVAPNGSDSALGTATAPYASINKAASVARAGQTIYLRGGVYTNSEYGQPFANRVNGSLARITTSGTSAAPITLRPHGNEYAKLHSDVTVLQFTEAKHWIVEGLEIEGDLPLLTLDDAMQTWWSEDNKKTGGRGISNGKSEGITIRNNIIHDLPGAGIASNDSDMIRVENNVIYRTGWWSTGGVHGVANSSLVTVVGNEGKEGLVMTGNLVFDNQSRIISHVFSKGNVDLAIDEGNGLHAQNNAKTFKGTARVENNLLLFNGKAGFGVNTMNNVTIKNNAFYQNAQVVNTGELALQSSIGTIIDQNLFQPLPIRKTLNDSAKNYTQLNTNNRINASTYGADSSSIAPSMLYSVVFNNPTAGDFSPIIGMPTGIGVGASHLQRMAEQVAEYGIMVEPSLLELVDAAYLCRMKRAIFTSWDNAPSDLKTITLTDRATGIEYSYADRELFGCEF